LSGVVGDSGIGVQVAVSTKSGTVVGDNKGINVVAWRVRGAAGKNSSGLVLGGGGKTLSSANGWVVDASGEAAVQEDILTVDGVDVDGTSKSLRTREASNGWWGSVLGVTVGTLDDNHEVMKSLRYSPLSEA